MASDMTRWSTTHTYTTSWLLYAFRYSRIVCIGPLPSSPVCHSCCARWYSSSLISPPLSLLKKASFGGSAVWLRHFSSVNHEYGNGNFFWFEPIAFMKDSREDPGA